MKKLNPQEKSHFQHTLPIYTLNFLYDYTLLKFIALVDISNIESKLL